MEQTKQAQNFSMLGISLVVCRNPETQKWLAVEECGDQGWWLPGGLVDPPQNFMQAAVRETVQQAGINCELQGILRIQYSIRDQQDQAHQRLRVVFYAEPLDTQQLPKTKKLIDFESQSARWVSIEELIDLKQTKYGWRGSHLYDWATYIEKGGVIYPMSLISAINLQDQNQKK